jgi:hypothetical protein
MICQACLNENSLFKTKFLKDCDDKIIGYYCSDCYKEKADILFKKRYVETYKNNEIFMKDGKYFVYWGCLYWFTSLKDAKKRTDMKASAFVEVGEIKFDKKSHLSLVQ